MEETTQFLRSICIYLFLNVNGFIIQKKKDSDTNLQRKKRRLKGKGNRAANQLDQAETKYFFTDRFCSSFNL